MSKFFDKLKISDDLVLNNRIIMAPMTRSRANDEGVQLAYTVEYYRQRASAGLIITEATNISPMAKGYIKTPGIFTDEQIAAWRVITDAVRDEGGRMFMQIFHTGRIALPDFLPEDVDKPVAPSAVRADGQNFTPAGMKDFVEPRPLGTEEIQKIVKDFGTAAGNAIKAGFDGVELHGANGYLVQQFLSSNVNLRDDDYGGSVENRARFLFEILEAMIEAVGDSTKVGVKLSPESSFNDIREDDPLKLYEYIIGKLNEMNLAYLYIGTADDSRNWHETLRPLYDGVYFAGEGFTKESGRDLLAENGADAIVYGKLFLANPDLPKRFRLDEELNDWDSDTFYQGGKDGYLDYPTLEEAKTVNTQY